MIQDGARRFCYDYENRLIGVSPASTDPCVSASTLALRYDPLGRLERTQAGATVTYLVYDGDRLVAEYNGASTTPLRRYVHGPGVDEPLVWYEGSALTDRRYLITDHQGSVIAENGATTNVHRYGPYGEPDTWTGSRFRYTGQIALPEVSLYHYKARVYDPVLGRFLQTDPVGYEDQLNLYAYVGNDPLNQTDPTGLAGCDASLSQSQCSQAMSEQTAADQAVTATRAALGQLRTERAAIQAGTQTSLSAGATATQSALRSAFGSSTNATIRAVDRSLANVQTFLRDPGTAAGGRYDWRAPTAQEMTNPSAAASLGFRNPGYRPDTVALNFPVFNNASQLDRSQTIVHEPLHVFGVSRPSVNGVLGERYRTDATALAQMRGGTTAAIYNNPDNYACLVFPGNC